MNVHEWVEEIYEAERDNIYSYLLYCGVSAAPAQELAQETFLKLYLKMNKGETIDNPKAWLYRVAHNLALRHHEREPRFDELDTNLAIAADGSNPERAAIEKERQSSLAQAIRELSPQQRNCLYLRGQGLRYREIGDAIGIGTSTVSEFLRRAVARLKESVDG